MAKNPQQNSVSEKELKISHYNELLQVVSQFANLLEKKEETVPESKEFISIQKELNLKYLTLVSQPLIWKFIGANEQINQLWQKDFCLELIRKINVKINEQGSEIGESYTAPQKTEPPKKQKSETKELWQDVRQQINLIQTKLARDISQDAGEPESPSDLTISDTPQDLALLATSLQADASEPTQGLVRIIAHKAEQNPEIKRKIVNAVAKDKNVDQDQITPEQVTKYIEEKVLTAISKTPDETPTRTQKKARIALIENSLLKAGVEEHQDLAKDLEEFDSLQRSQASESKKDALEKKLLDQKTPEIQPVIELIKQDVNPIQALEELSKKEVLDPKTKKALAIKTTQWSTDSTPEQKEILLKETVELVVPNTLKNFAEVSSAIKSLSQPPTTTSPQVETVLESETESKTIYSAPDTVNSTTEDKQTKTQPNKEESIQIIRETFGQNSDKLIQSLKNGRNPVDAIVETFSEPTQNSQSPVSLTVSSAMAYEAQRPTLSTSPEKLLTPKVFEEKISAQLKEIDNSDLFQKSSSEYIAITVDSLIIEANESKSFDPNNYKKIAVIAGSNLDLATKSKILTSLTQEDLETSETFSLHVNSLGFLSETQKDNLITLAKTKEISATDSKSISELISYKLKTTFNTHIAHNRSHLANKATIQELDKQLGLLGVSFEGLAKTETETNLGFYAGFITKSIGQGNSEYTAPIEIYTFFSSRQVDEFADVINTLYASSNNPDNILSLTWEISTSQSSDQQIITSASLATTIVRTQNQFRNMVPVDRQPFINNIVAQTISASPFKKPLGLFSSIAQIKSKNLINDAQAGTSRLMESLGQAFSGLGNKGLGGGEKDKSNGVGGTLASLMNLGSLASSLASFATTLATGAATAAGIAAKFAAPLLKGAFSAASGLASSAASALASGASSMFSAISAGIAQSAAISGTLAAISSVAVLGASMTLGFLGIATILTAFSTPRGVREVGNDLYNLNKKVMLVDTNDDYTQLIGTKDFNNEVMVSNEDFKKYDFLVYRITIKLKQGVLDEGQRIDLSGATASTPHEDRMSLTSTQNYEELGVTYQNGDYLVPFKAQPGRPIECNLFDGAGFTAFNGLLTQADLQSTRIDNLWYEGETQASICYIVSLKEHPHFAGKNLDDTRITNEFTLNPRLIDKDNSEISADLADTVRAHVYVGDAPLFQGGGGCWPTDGTITQLPFNDDFAAKIGFTHKNNDAYDIAGVEGTPIYAPFGGKLEIFPNNTLFPIKDEDGIVLEGTGNAAVLITVSEGHYIFQHMFEYNPDIIDGQRIEEGELIGYMGNTGNSTGPHLHYEYRKNYNVAASCKTTDTCLEEDSYLAQTVPSDINGDPVTTVDQIVSSSTCGSGGNSNTPVKETVGCFVFSDGNKEWDVENEIEPIKQVLQEKILDNELLNELVCGGGKDIYLTRTGDYCTAKAGDNGVGSWAGYTKSATQIDFYDCLFDEEFGGFETGTYGRFSVIHEVGHIIGAKYAQDFYPFLRFYNFFKSDGPDSFYGTSYPYKYNSVDENVLLRENSGEAFSACLTQDYSGHYRGGKPLPPNFNLQCNTMNQLLETLR